MADFGQAATDGIGPDPAAGLSIPTPSLVFRTTPIGTASAGVSIRKLWSAMRLRAPSWKGHGCDLGRATKISEMS